MTPLSFDASFLENPREYPHKLHVARNYMFAAESIGLSVFVFTQLFSKPGKVVLDLQVQKQNLI